MQRASSARGHLRDQVRGYIVSHYKLDVDTSKAKAVAANITRLEFLREGAPRRFCYKVRDKLLHHLYCKLM